VAHPETVIERRLPARLPVEVDTGRFSQVIANLLSNARHHGSGGPIAIAAREEGDAAVVSVSNPGEPIAPEIAASLFDPFKRESVRNVRNPSGMGLGLFIADQVVRGHGGQLRYEAAEGEVRFELRIPLLQPSGASRQAPGPAA
jgi:signal transduction histidine kinase